MNTSGIDSDLVKTLRKRESSFQHYKIHMLLAGIFQFSLAAFMVVFLQKHDRLLQSPELISMTSLISCLMILSGFVGFMMIVTCIRDWRGNPTNLLLLQMIDRESNYEDKPNNKSAHLTVGNVLL
jgi:drug/metabolite transporter (DMT)-like permease